MPSAGLRALSGGAAVTQGMSKQSPTREACPPDTVGTPQRRSARVAKAAAAAAALVPAMPPPSLSATVAATAVAPAAASVVLRTTAMLQEAVDMLAKADPRLAPLMQQHGLPERLLLKPGSHFVALAKSICFQQLAITAAAAIFRRFLATCGAADKEGLTPAKVLAVDMAQLRACGLSERKASYLQDLARHFQDGRLSDELLAGAGDAELVEVLTRVKGIGAWTAHMFEMFSLGKSDVLPVGDLGVRKGFQALFGLKALPSPEEMAKLTEHWRPYRSVGCYYMWQMPSTTTSTLERKKRLVAKSLVPGGEAAAAAVAQVGMAAVGTPRLLATVLEEPLLMTPPQKRQRKPTRNSTV